MNNQLLLLIQKHTKMLIEQKKTKPQETLEIKVNKQMETFSCPSPINLSDEGKWLLAVTSIGATNSVFIVIDENNSFSITTPGRWNSEGSEKLTDKLNEILEHRSENDIELHVEEVDKRGT